MRAAESKAGVQSAQGMENGSQDELSGSESLESLARRRRVPTNELSLLYKLPDMMGPIQ